MEDGVIVTKLRYVAGQKDRLEKAGAIRIFQDVISGKQFERPGLLELIYHARAGDSLCVVRLDRLGRSLKEMLEAVDDLKVRGVNLVTTGAAWRCGRQQ